MTCSSAGAHSRYTGKERDTESGNDYFGARYYTSTMGRFMSPDWSSRPEAMPYSSLGNPQSLNLYAYVGNNPISGYDRGGEARLWRARL
jgi:RHS repeat-associated protein